MFNRNTTSLQQIIAAGNRIGAVTAGAGQLSNARLALTITDRYRSGSRAFRGFNAAEAGL